jgi:hypothetical protein
LRRINSRTSLNKGAGESPKLLFNSSRRWTSASFESLPLGNHVYMGTSAHLTVSD